MRKILLASSFVLFVMLNTYSQTWTNLITGVGTTSSDYVLSLAVDSATNELYIGGTFNTVSGQPFHNLVKWDGANYANVGADGAVNALAKLNGNMYASGSFATIGGTAANRMALFNGTSWQPLGNGVNAPAYAFAWYGGLLYSGGGFSAVNGFSTGANHIAKWNGSTWATVGSGSNNGTTATGCCQSGDVNALCVYNGNLYVGGDFSKAGGVAASCIAKWNGTAWSAVGGGINTYVTSLVVYNNELYAGGNFTTAGGVTAHNIARWNGTTWASVGSPTTLNNPVWAMEVINNELYVAGSFSGVITSGTSRFVAKWNGTSWSDVTTGAGTDNLAYAIAGVPTGWVYAGGGFLSGDGNSNDIHIARLSVPTLLPVELISFAAGGEKNFIHLTWSTASEINSSGFELQRSPDANNFEKIDWLMGQGNATSVTNYFYDDKNVQPGRIYYYRLEQIDFNGEEKYSAIIDAKISDEKSLNFVINGNPVQQSAIISWDLPAEDHVQVILCEATGKQIHILENSNEAKGGHFLTLDKTSLNLSQGIYLLTLSTSSQSITRKLVIQ